MAIHLSTKAMTWIAGGGSVKQQVEGCVLRLYSVAPPASPNTAFGGTLLLEYTLASGARTAEVLARGKVTLTGGASGTVDTITVEIVSGGATVDLLGGVPVTYATSLANTASLVCAQINKARTYPDYLAIPSGADIILQAPPGTGTSRNGFAVSCTSTTITTTNEDIGTTVAGVAQANGLTWSDAVAGVLSQAGTWSGVGLANGTAAGFRFTGTIADANGTESANPYLQFRIDGTVSATPGAADLIMSPTADIVLSATHTMTSFTLTTPS